MKSRIWLRLLRDLTYKLLIICCVGSLFFSLFGLCGTLHRFGELATHFRVQYLALSLFSAAGFAAFRAWRWLAASLPGVLLNAFLVVPMLALTTAGQAAGNAHNFRVLLANVLYNNSNYEAVKELVRSENPDVIVLQEATETWVAAMQDLRITWPYFRYSGEYIGAIACYSRYPLDNFAPALTSQADHWTLLTKVKMQSGDVSFVSIHPPVPVGALEYPIRNQRLAMTASLAQSMPRPVIVIGDFNCTPWSPYFTKFVRESGLVNARDGFGILPTWPTFLPPMMIPIDHCLISPDVKVMNCRTGSFIGSDHLPLIVDLVVLEH